ncbi:coproporphyrinogen III oxidase [Psychromonas sp. KJ10-10]|uniref:coproporphyrinogen III oxidase n=1 Tax=Psychromonas sp. KJ10-10 TaxID=3391823 RepID=UPI0039B64FCB
MRKPATSEKAISALNMLTKAQKYFVKQLSLVCQKNSLAEQFTAKQWLRDNGIHGGGVRYEAPINSLFNQASVNVSQIQYEDMPEKAFVSATALSTIIHPVSPLAPSVHIHVSWTELRNGKSYWRVMADLNPAIESQQDTEIFNQTLKNVSGKYFKHAKEAGDKYFHILALQTHRGVSHFYLEGFNPENVSGLVFCEDFLFAVIDTYIAIFSEKVSQQKATNQTISIAEKQQQLDYHTLYLYQVLTLDKGTTAGLLIHDQNDLGTLASLSRFINQSLLTSWIDKTAHPFNELVQAIVSVLPNADKDSDIQICEITDDIKILITGAMRSYYKIHPLKKSN